MGLIWDDALGPARRRGRGRGDPRESRPPAARDAAPSGRHDHAGRSPAGHPADVIGRALRAARRRGAGRASLPALPPPRAHRPPARRGFALRWGDLDFRAREMTRRESGGRVRPTTFWRPGIVISSSRFRLTLAVRSSWVIVVHWVVPVDEVVAVRRGRRLSSSLWSRGRARPPPLSSVSSRRGNLDALSDRIRPYLSSDSVQDDASPRITRRRTIQWQPI